MGDFVEVSFPIVISQFQSLRTILAADEAIDLPPFRVADKKFRVSVFPKQSHDDDAIGVYLTAWFPQTMICSMDVGVRKLADEWGYVYYDQVFVNEVMITGFQLGDDVLSWKQMLDDNFFSFSDTLHLRIHLRFVDSDNPAMGSEVDHHNKTLLDLKYDMTQMWKSRDESDVTLVAGGVEHKAHRLILAHRSPVFRAMFSTGMLESRTSRVDIPEFDSDTVMHLLQFIYCAGLQSKTVYYDVQQLCCLLKAANKYEVSSLEMICCEQLKALLTEQNILQIMVIANELDLPDLYAFTMKFATRDRKTMQAIVDSPAFDDLDRDLACKLLTSWNGFSRKRNQLEPDSSELEFPEGTDWQSLSMASLQRACDERSLPCSGPKRHLVLRLESYTSP